MKDHRDDAPWAANPPDAGADPERLAALLDGRVDGAERDALLARLADHDDDLALFAEAAAIQRALEEEDAAARPVASDAHGAPMVKATRPAASHPHAIPVDTAADEPAYEPDVIPIRRRTQRVDRRLVQLAAVLAGVTLLPLAWVAGRPGAVSSPSQAVAMLDDRDTGPPEEWPHPWTRRGGGAPVQERPTPAAIRSIAAKVGALAVDLELAIRAGDVEQRTIRVGQIQAELANISGMAGSGFRVLEDRTRTDREQLLSDLESAVEMATGFVDADFVALGGWTEAARFATKDKDAAFFRSTRTARTLAKAETLLGDNPQARAALAQIATARAADPPGWRALEEAAYELLRVIAP